MKRCLLPFLLCLILLSCFSRQRYHHFETRTPLAEGDALVLGFLGGRQSWNNSREGVRRLALELRAMNQPGLHVETVENVRRDLALQLVQNALDSDRNGTLTGNEKESARLILYGQSFGGAAVVKFANQLHQLKIPVLLTIQIDSVGRHDDVLPENVRAAANLFQRNGILIRGESEIRAQNPVKTRIIGNFEFDYSNKQIDLSSVDWYKKIFRNSHTKMNQDPEVWEKVKELIVKMRNEK
ncbi:hypothetical protein L0222_21830 [bacterium]|nr:hypothetical protein [bacterium]MCI0601753.1 hypothetical protein [bacterium]